MPVVRWSFVLLTRGIYIEIYRGMPLTAFKLYIIPIQIPQIEDLSSVHGGHFC